jgi:hypothetical protein
VVTYSQVFTMNATESCAIGTFAMDDPEVLRLLRRIEALKMLPIAPVPGFATRITGFATSMSPCREPSLRDWKVNSALNCRISADVGWQTLAEWRDRGTSSSADMQIGHCQLLGRTRYRHERSVM